MEKEVLVGLFHQTRILFSKLNYWKLCQLQLQNNKQTISIIVKGINFRVNPFFSIVSFKLFFFTTKGTKQNKGTEDFSFVPLFYKSSLMLLYLL
jgi:hypothetical protein